MKSYIPTKRLIALGLVLQFDSYKKEGSKTEVGKTGFFTVNQRILINQERARLLDEDQSFIQNEVLETKINFVANQIRTSEWFPEKPIQYE